MSDFTSKIVPAASSVPGMPAGGSSVAPVVATSTPAPNTETPLGIDAKSSFVKFGGNPSGRARNDGLKPGSPEAGEADRKRNAERMANKRAADKAALPAAPLPSAVRDGQEPPVAEVGAVGGAFALSTPDWCASDFQQVSVDVVDLVDEANIARKTKRARDGKLSEVVVKKIAVDVAFPTASKRSLQSTSPALLAKLFNAMKVPVTLKPAITTFPALTYLIVRDLQQSANIEKMILAEAERAAAAKATETAKS